MRETSIIAFGTAERTSVCVCVYGMHVRYKHVVLLTLVRMVGERNDERRP